MAQPGSYKFDIPAGEKAVQMLDQFAEDFHKRVNRLEQEIINDFNSRHEGQTAGAINTGSSALDSKAVDVKSTVIDMGSRLTGAARDYAAGDTTSSESVSRSGSEVSNIQPIR
ncbi:MAG: hypothetical protein RI885_2647 [Actinomycetota bacterium]|jgi:uncharacterized membrane protein YqiK